jgi:hypothetical protein
MLMLPDPLCTCNGVLHILSACLVLLIWKRDALRAPAWRLREQITQQGLSTLLLVDLWVALGLLAWRLTSAKSCTSPLNCDHHDDAFTPA